MKWLWRYAQEPQTLWSSVIKRKYGEEDCWVPKEVTSPYEVNLWRSTRALWAYLEKYLMIRVHNGVRTKFWKDKWIETRSLQELFPNLFDLAQDQHNSSWDVDSNKDGYEIQKRDEWWGDPKSGWTIQINRELSRGARRCRLFVLEWTP